MNNTQKQFAWIHPDGRWLTYSEYTTHTGTHRKAGLTNEIDKAYTAPFSPWQGRVRERITSDDGLDHTKLTQVPVLVKQLREVRLELPMGWPIGQTVGAEEAVEAATTLPVPTEKAAFDHAYHWFEEREKTNFDSCGHIASLDKKRYISLVTLAFTEGWVKAMEHCAMVKKAQQ
jgi:hypothetical protein